MPPQPQLFRRCTSFSSASRVTPGWGQQPTHVHSYRCVCPSSCKGQPGTEASPQPGGSGRPSAAPTPCRLPPCSHLCTTMSGIFLSAQLGGRWCVGLGALPAPGPWPEASPPSSPHACPPAHPGWQGRAGPRLPKSLGGAGTREPDGDTHPARPRQRQPGHARQQCHSCWAAGLGTPPAPWGQQSIGQCPQDMDGHAQHPPTSRHMHCVTPVHTRDTLHMADNQCQSPGPRNLSLRGGDRMRRAAHASHHPRTGTRPTEQHLPSPSGRGGGQGRLWTLAFPPCLIYPITQLCIPTPGPPLGSGVPTDE